MADEVVWSGPEALRPLLVPIGELELDPENARRHSERNLAVIKNSFREYGQDQLVVATEDGIVQKGNARLMVARELGWTHVVAVRTDDEGMRAKLRGLVDNRSGDSDVGSDWDFPNLSELLLSLDTGDFDLKDFGWTDEEVERIVTWGEKPDDDPEPSKNREPQIIVCPECGHEFRKGN